MDAESDTEFIKTFVKNNFVKPTEKSLQKVSTGLLRLDNDFMQQFETLEVNG